MPQRGGKTAAGDAARSCSGNCGDYIIVAGAASSGDVQGGQTLTDDMLPVLADVVRFGVQHGLVPGLDGGVFVVQVVTIERIAHFQT